MSNRTPPSSPPVYDAGDRATAPAALEETSASAWQRFEELQNAHSGQFAPTAPGTRPPGGPASGFAPTQPMDALAPAAAPAAAAPLRSVTLDDLMLLARRNNRACPMPAQWAAFHRLLPSRAVEGRTLTAPVPVDGAAWSVTSAMQKRLRLRDQLEWAERVGALPAAYAFLSALTEEQWQHFD
jgi:hypothetical protein